MFYMVSIQFKQLESHKCRSTDEMKPFGTCNWSLGFITLKLVQRQTQQFLCLFVYLPFCEVLAYRLVN